MVNYRRVVCEVALLGALLAVSTAAPTPDCGHSAHVHYDQRQNGSENYRLSIDGLVVAVAPEESLVSALGGMEDILDLLDLEDFDVKPKPPPSSPSPSPSPAIDMVPVSVEGEKPLSKPDEKPLLTKPEEKPSELKPVEEKPQGKPEEEKPVEKDSLSDVSLNDDVKVQKKEVSGKKGQRLKNRLASFIMPFLRKARHLQNK